MAIYVFSLNALMHNIRTVKWVNYNFHLDMSLPPTAAVNGQTPLSLACANRHLNVSQYLVEEQHCDPKGMCTCMV